MSIGRGCNSNHYYAILQCCSKFQFCGPDIRQCERSAKNFFNQDSVIVISQKWHNQRGIYLADNIGINAIGYNAADVNTRAAHITHAREILARVKLELSLL